MYTKLDVAAELDTVRPGFSTFLQAIHMLTEHIPISPQKINELYPDGVPAIFDKARGYGFLARSDYAGHLCNYCHIGPHYGEMYIVASVSLKNYSGEIAAFLDFLKPYVSEGHILFGDAANFPYAVSYYECDEQPTYYWPPNE